jgi:uncharacterized protein YwgA
MRINELVCCAAKAIDEDIFSEFKDKLAERIILQKIIYLIQEKGYDMGFKFNWYIRGPYSPKLADCGYEISNKYREQYEKCRIDMKDDAKIFIDTLKKKIYSEDKGLRPAEKAELLASLHYLRVHNMGAEGPSEKEVVEELVKIKSNYTEEQACSAYEELKEMALL